MSVISEETYVGFEPRIVGFICNWGAYSGLEMAGMNKTRYAPNVQFVRLMCLGRVHAGLVLKAFELGADGVMLMGCPSGSCRYEFGIGKTKELVAQVGAILNLLGVGSQRLFLVEVPLGGGAFLARRVNAFVRRIESLGPSPVKYAQKQDESIQDVLSLS